MRKKIHKNNYFREFYGNIVLSVLYIEREEEQKKNNKVLESMSLSCMYYRRIRLIVQDEASRIQGRNM